MLIGNARSQPPVRGPSSGPRRSDPAVGEKGRRETVQEMRLEVVCPAEKLPGVLASIRARHSYEEPAIDVYPLHEIQPARGTTAVAGAGRIGRFVEPRSLAEFSAFVGRALGRIAVLMVGDPQPTGVPGGGRLRSR